MPRLNLTDEVHSESLGPIEQPAPIEDLSAYDGEVVFAEKVFTQPYLEELAFNEEPVTVRLEPSAERNAPTSAPFWVNGKPAEVFTQGRWIECGHLPIGQILTIKRKVLERIICNKITNVDNEIQDRASERPNNVIKRNTMPVRGFSVLEDRNPRGAAWMAELYRRQA